MRVRVCARGGGEGGQSDDASEDGLGGSGSDAERGGAEAHAQWEEAIWALRRAATDGDE